MQSESILKIRYCYNITESDKPLQKILSEDINTIYEKYMTKGRSSITLDNNDDDDVSSTTGLRKKAYDKKR